MRKNFHKKYNKEKKQKISPKQKGRFFKKEEIKYIRLNKFIANSGICSRRKADEYIKAGYVTVNGEVVRELGYKIKRGDEVRFKGKKLRGEPRVYIVMNKPKNTITTAHDPEGRKTVMDLLKGKIKVRVYPVGRLDRNTTGVLLLTNDGELAQKLLHPSAQVPKTYVATLDKDVEKNDLQQLVEGIELEDGPINADAVFYFNEKNKNKIVIQIHSGRNRIVRRMFEYLGYDVKSLDRIEFAGLTKKNIKRGDWRLLTPKEIGFLKMMAGKTKRK